MSRKKLALHSTYLVAFLLGFVPLVSSSPTLAQSGSPPRNLRVTGVTDWTVRLAWDAPKGKAPASYVIQCSNGRSMTVPGSHTTATFSSGFDYNRTYSFRAYAVSPNGSWSGASNTVTATLLQDTTPPPRPVVSDAGIGPTHVDLVWSCPDTSPSLRFDVYKNGFLLHGQIAGTSKRIVFLSPNTTYTFTVRARDSAGNWSEMSEEFVVTTPPAEPDDEPPTMPPGLWGGIIDGATEAMVFWSASTDNVTPQEHIGYYVYLNGVFEGATIDPYPRQFSLYLTPGIVNTIEVYAVDEAGNRSAPATMLIDMGTP
jgi:chitodextrinase